MRHVIIASLLIAFAAAKVEHAAAQDLAKQLAELLQQATEAQQLADGETEPSDESTPNAQQERRTGSAHIEISPGGAVQLELIDASLASVLQLLSIQSRRPIVASPAVRGQVTAFMYDVTFEEALNAILASQQAGYREQGSFIYVYTNLELAAQDAAAQPVATRVFELNYLGAIDAQTMVLPLLSPEGAVSISPAANVGLATSAEEAGGNTMAAQELLVVHDHPENIEKIAEVLRQLDQRPRQVLIEATILRAQLSEDNALGIDFTLTGGVSLDVLGAESAGVTNLTVGNLPDDRWEDFNSRVVTDFTGAVPNGGVTFGVVQDHVGVFVRALEGIADTTVIANPKVLALNKQRGEVIVGRQDGYPVILTTETTSQQTSAMLDTGTRLIFRPFISNDGYVRMELHPEDSRGEVVGGQPQKETTEVTTNVIVKDGQTILIGGLFRESTRDARAQIPLLGDIPVFGTLFQSRRDTTEREEVIILLTVHVVKEDVYSNMSEAELARIERIRVGSRRGIMPFGRERLAQFHYQQAVELYAQGRDEKALWHVNLALHNEPRMPAALELKDRLLGDRDWDDEGSMTRSFIHELIAEDRGEEAPFLDRPAPPFERDSVDGDFDSPPQLVTPELED